MVGTMARIDDSVKKKVPELRFPGFTDDWEERKFADFIDVKSGKDYKHLNSGSIPVYGTGGYMLSVDRALSDIDAIGIGRKGTIDKPYLLKAPFWTVDTLFYAVPKQNIDLQFSLSIFKKINWKKFDESTGVPSLSKTVINSVGASVPSYEEQQKIGSFFKQLDNTIALHQLKLDLLKEQKKGYLQKMFPKNGAKVPELRFAGFADDWEERKLSDVANHRGGTAIEKYFDKDGVYKVISIGSYGLNSQYVDQNIRAISNEITDGRVVNSGELTMVLNDKTANGTIIGRTLLVEKDNEYVINQRTEIISPKENFDSNFAYTILNGPFREKVKRIVQGGTQIYVNYPAVSNLNLELPKIEEQQKIGSFFKQLDDTIALHQRKLDLLKEQKKGFLQKMFPKNGAKVPELRFAGFADDWEERKLGDVVGEIQSGNRLPKDSLTSGNIPYVVAQTKNEGVFKTISKKTLDYNGNPMKLFPGNSISFSIDNPEAMFYRSTEFYTSNIMRVIHADYLSHQQYLFILENMKSFTRGYDWSRKFSGPVVSNLEYLQPNEQEQCKIGSFILAFDNIITLHQRKLDLLKEQKKGLLQKMFV